YLLPELSSPPPLHVPSHDERITQIATHHVHRALPPRIANEAGSRQRRDQIELARVLNDTRAIHFPYDIDSSLDLRGDEDVIPVLHREVLRGITLSEELDKIHRQNSSTACHIGKLQISPRGEAPSLRQGIERRAAYYEDWARPYHLARHIDFLAIQGWHHQRIVRFQGHVLRQVALQQ